MRILILSLFLATGVPAIAMASDLDDRISATLEEQGLVGAVWATVGPTGEVAVGAAGRKDARLPQALDATDRVQVGSVAKPVLATGILLLVSQGRVSLDDPVASLLPDVAFDNPWEATDPVRLQHLLDQTSGLEDARLWQVFTVQATPDTPLSEVFSRDPAVLRVRSRPGTRTSYSNMGYTLVGRVIEAVTGERYESFLAKKLLAPLGMHDSTFGFVTQEGPGADTRLAMGHFEGGATQAAVPLYLRPGGQFTTTASDMGSFIRFLMSNGEIDGKPFIASHLLRAMGRPTTTEAASAGLVDAGYGLGLNSRDRHGVLGNCHVGTTVGFRANFCLFPKVRRAFFVAMNADVETADYDRFDALLVRELGIAAAIPTKGAAPPNAIADWQGVYVLAPGRMESFAYLDRVLNFATVRWNGQQLHLKPFQSTTKSLLPVGGWMFRAEDRTWASHVLLVSKDARRIISDGFRSYEQISLWRMLPLWASLLAGMVGLLHLILFGIFRMLRRRLSTADPLFIPALASVALFLPVPLFFSQSFLQLGDLTPASVLLALVTGMLPLAMIFGLWRHLQQRPRDVLARVDGLAMLAVLQWALVLAGWGLLPLRLWV